MLLNWTARADFLLVESDILVYRSHIVHSSFCPLLLLQKDQVSQPINERLSQNRSRNQFPVVNARKYLVANDHYCSINEPSTGQSWLVKYVGFTFLHPASLNFTKLPTPTQWSLNATCVVPNSGQPRDFVDTRNFFAQVNRIYLYF
jgi:hypothetical protein